MPVVIKGSGTVEGIAVGGLPDAIVDADMLASNAVTSVKILDDAVTATKIVGAAVTSGSLATNAKQVLQVVYASTTDTFNSSSSTFVATPCTLAITPTVSTSKIYLQLSPAIWAPSGQYLHLEVRATGGASGTILAFGDWYNSYYGNTPLLGVHTGHNTTSAITYTIWGRSDGASWYCPNNNSDSDIDQRYTGLAWEVAV